MAEETGERVKFQTVRLGDFNAVITKDSDRHMVENASNELADALREMEILGVTPVMGDGRVGGNGAVLVDINGKTYILVSKTGKLCGRMDITTDLCLVSSFDSIKWSAEYYSVSDDVLPTSDTPLHWNILQEIKKFQWTSNPRWCLHGHAFETEEIATSLKLPISTKQTAHSTPADTEALMTLLEQYSYPENSVFVRRGHGFLALSETCKEAVNRIKALKLQADGSSAAV